MQILSDYIPLIYPALWINAILYYLLIIFWISRYHVIFASIGMGLMIVSRLLDYYISIDMKKLTSDDIFVDLLELTILIICLIIIIRWAIKKTRAFSHLKHNAMILAVFIISFTIGLIARIVESSSLVIYIPSFVAFIIGAIKFREYKKEEEFNI